MAATDKRRWRAQRRQRRGVVAAEQQMPALGRNQATFALRMGAPKHEHQRLTLLGNLGDEGVRQALPALAGMAGGLALLHRQSGVEQQHAALGPTHQAAAGLRQGRRRQA